MNITSSDKWMDHNTSKYICSKLTIESWDFEKTQLKTMNTTSSEKLKDHNTSKYVCLKFWIDSSHFFIYPVSPI